ncbi:MAG: hypothetical protein ACYC5H_10755 [Methylovirgula sp.]
MAPAWANVAAARPAAAHLVQDLRHFDDLAGEIGLRRGKSSY